MHSEVPEVFVAIRRADATRGAAVSRAAADSTADSTTEDSLEGRPGTVITNYLKGRGYLRMSGRLGTHPLDATTCHNTLRFICCRDMALIQYVIELGGNKMATLFLMA